MSLGKTYPPSAPLAYTLKTETLVTNISKNNAWLVGVLNAVAHVNLKFWFSLGLYARPIFGETWRPSFWSGLNSQLIGL